MFNPSNLYFLTLSSSATNASQCSCSFFFLLAATGTLHILFIRFQGLPLKEACQSFRNAGQHTVYLLHQYVRGDHIPVLQRIKVQPELFCLLFIWMLIQIWLNSAKLAEEIKILHLAILLLNIPLIYVADLPYSSIAKGNRWSHGRKATSSTFHSWQRPKIIECYYYDT